MDDLDVGDDGYSDDDLDALPENAFHELQEDAFRSTQQPTARPQLPAVGRSSRPGPAEVAGGFGRLSVSGPSKGGHDSHGSHQPSSDYGDFDDEMLDGEIFDAAAEPALAARYETPDVQYLTKESTQREQWREQRYGAPPANAGNHPMRQPVTTNGTVSSHKDSGAGQLDSRTQSKSKGPGISIQPSPEASVDANALQDQVQKLLQERESLQKAIQAANDTAYAKAGEIAIVRANAAKVEKEFETRTMSLQKLHADEAARQKIEVERSRAELQKIATEKDFLENDLAEGTKQIRNLQKTIKKGSGKSTGKENQLTTPKKNKGIPLRDGFDDDEVLPMSPSKLALRSKVSTPKAGAKRKRKVPEDSPVKSLELAQSKENDVTGKPEKSFAPTVTAAISPGPTRPDQRFQLTQKLMDHRFEGEESRTFERFAGFSFPSQSEKAFSTLLLDEMSSLTYESDIDGFPSAMAHIIISMWSRCMEEKFHEPVHLLVDLVKFILELNPIKTAPDLTNELMSLVQSTADVILVPRCQKKPPRKDRADIDSTDCLDIMQMMAYDCQWDPEEITRFWRTMRFDFIMMLLNFINPVSEIHLMLSLLRTSILEKSFAMIVPPNNNQDASEAHIIDNLSHLLINTPRPPPGEAPPDAAELCDLRLEVLSLLEAMCDTTHSAESLAKHRLVVGYLVRVMNDELDRVYDHQYGHELRVALVNQSTRLLYYLTNNFPHLINMQTKLSVVPGGEKKFLIVLTRLAFSEGGFYEDGIDDDVVDCAHQMLEARVSPEEAEGLVEAFSTAPVSRK